MQDFVVVRRGRVGTCPVPSMVPGPQIPTALVRGQGHFSRPKGRHWDAGRPGAHQGGALLRLPLSRDSRRSNRQAKLGHVGPVPALRGPSPPRGTEP